MPESQQIDIALIDTNDGQISDVPENPRTIKEDRFKQLVESIREYPELTQLRELLVYPLNGRYVTISGNMRLRAMRELAYTQCPCKVLPVETPAKTLRAYVIKENLPYGETDKDALANNWNNDELLAFDMPPWEMGGFEADSDSEATEPQEKEPVICPHCGYIIDDGKLTKQAYSLRARKLIGDHCDTCGITDSLVVHHRDKNKANNVPDNIQTLCKPCHDALHAAEKHAAAVANSNT